MTTERRTGRSGGAESFVAGEEEVEKAIGHNKWWRPALAQPDPSREAHMTGPQ
jgi:hypothetical protein